MRNLTSDSNTTESTAVSSSKQLFQEFFTFSHNNGLIMRIKRKKLSHNLAHYLGVFYQIVAKPRLPITYRNYLILLLLELCSKDIGSYWIRHNANFLQKFGSFPVP